MIDLAAIPLRKQYLILTLNCCLECRTLGDKVRSVLYFQIRPIVRLNGKLQYLPEANLITSQETVARPGPETVNDFHQKALAAFDLEAVLSRINQALPKI